MTLGPGARKLVVAAHVIFTVGWLGAVVAFLALAIVGVTGAEAQQVRGAYVAMGVIARFVIVPLSFAPFVTGPILALGTPWGLIRHYWIIAKLVINVACTLVLLVHLGPIDHLATAAVSRPLSAADAPAQRQMLVAAVAAVVALLAATILAVYKPRGLTPYGWHRQQERGGTLSREIERETIG